MGRWRTISLFVVLAVLMVALYPLPSALAAADEYTVTLFVRDSNLSAGWPLYAHLNIADTTYNDIYTDPVTGKVQVTLAAGTYDVTVDVIWPGYPQQTVQITVNQDGVIDIPVDVDASACNAPGYEREGFFEDFDGDVFPPEGWSVVDNIDGESLVWKWNTDYDLANLTGGEGLSAAVNSDQPFDGIPFDTELRTPPIDPETLPTLTLYYKADFQYYGVDDYAEALDLDISVDNGASWTNLAHWQEADYHGEFAVDLSPYVGDSPFILRWRYYSPEDQPWDYHAEVDDVSLSLCHPVADGLIVGDVTDANTGDPVGQVAVSDGAGQEVTWVDNDDPDTPFSLFVIAEEVGSVTLEATDAPYAYDVASTTVDVNAGAVSWASVPLPAALLAPDSDALIFTLYTTEPTVSEPLALSNDGGLATPFEVFAVKGAAPHFNAPLSLRQQSRATPRAIRASALIHQPPAGHYQPPKLPTGVGAAVTPKAAGDVLSQWDPNLALPWGIEVAQESGNVWVGDTAAGTTSGQDADYEYQPDGTATGQQIPISWLENVNTMAMGMAYDPFTHSLWQTDAGNDYCVHELDPINLTVTGRQVCPMIPPPNGLLLTGLAFDPLTNTFFGGTWLDNGKVYRFDMDGNILEEKTLNIPITGLAYNPSTHHLFILVRADTQPEDWRDIYIVDTDDNYNFIGGFDVGGDPSVLNPNGQSSLGHDCNGHLWLTDHGDSEGNGKQVYEVDSGETGWCDWAVDWLSVSPQQGSLDAQGSASLNVSIDLTDQPPGTYEAHLLFAGYTPYSEPITDIQVQLKDNDVFADALPLGVPDSAIREVDNATAAADDPDICGVAPHQTLWYQITPTTTHAIGIDTFLSDYDTVVGVFQGSAGNLTSVACNDDENGPQSHLSFTGTAGETYFVVVGAKNEGASGDLHLHVASFPDVTGDQWYWKFVEALYAQGITSGYPDGTFRPQNQVTRAEIAVFLLRALYGNTYTPPTHSSYSFPDIADHWARDWIEEAKTEGLVSGYPDGTYRPNNQVTRAETAVLLLRAEHGSEYNPPTHANYSFSDIVDHWAKDWIQDLYDEGFVSGYPDGTYRPNNPVTRAEMATMLDRVFNYPLPDLTP